MIYTIDAKRDATVEEVIRLEVEAYSLSEALDFAYELASEFPNTDMACSRAVIITRDYLGVENINTELLKVEGSPVNDDDRA